MKIVFSVGKKRGAINSPEKLKNYLTQKLKWNVVIVSSHFKVG